MKLLVVGGSGFIGRHFLTTDLDGHEVTATYATDASFPAFTERLAVRVRPMQCDLLASDNDFSSFDAAVYMAGNSNHTWALEHPDEDMRLNGVAMGAFLKTFSGDLVLLSTGAVYFGHEGRVSPASPADPKFPYAASKLAAELLCGWAAATGRLRSLKVLRLYYAFGPGEEERRLIRRALVQFGVRRDAHFRINGAGKSVMAPMHVRDVAEALQLALSGPEGTYDLPSAKPQTVLEIVKAAAAVCEVEPEIEFVESDEKTLTFYSDQRPFAEAFGFEQKLTLDQGMRCYLEDLRREAAS